MTEKQIKLAIGSMLHDIGKIVYRSGDGRNHSQSGVGFLREEANINDTVILNCVRFHHGCYLKNAQIPEDDCAYITYYADNIAAAADRRERQEAEEGFDRQVPLDSVFNILNGNQGHSHYVMQTLNDGLESVYPTEEKVKMNADFYTNVVRNIKNNLKGIYYSEEYLNSLLSILEANLSYIPSSTSRRELTDISLYDHLKITTAIALCVEQYLTEQGEYFYKEKLFDKADDSYSEKMFLLYSMDISGIQDFIYTISSKGALRGLRARSFYLEILMEHMIDELLGKLSLCRANLIYSGGGHCYLLLPNTKTVRQVVEEQEKSVNKWFLEVFGTALYVAGGYASCSSKDLRNEPAGSYSELYREISLIISKKKGCRYEAQDIIALNAAEHKGERECSICRRMGKTDEENKCSICAAMEQMASSVLYEDFFTVIDKFEKGSLSLPGGKYLVADNKQQLLKRMENESYVRSYTKNEVYTGKHVTTKLWIGDYTTRDSFEEFAQKAKGVKRIGILRADVDNLGNTFVNGFQRTDGDDRYVTLSRTAALSRQLSMFFKKHINGLLEKGESDYLSNGGKRNITIVYSGGDDVFLVGAWNEVIDAFIDLHNALYRFTQGTLSISGGIGIYPSGYPVNVMAKEVAALEERAKEHDGKNAVTIFEKKGMYGWDCFIKDVLEEKFRLTDTFFGVSENHGKAFLYHLLDLLRGSEEKINTARYVYLLSRMEPDAECKEEQREAYRHFSRKMYEWRMDPEVRRRLITAIYLYVYLTRDEEENQ